MHTTSLSSKGQVIIPKAIRTALQWNPGTSLQVQGTADGVLLRPAALSDKVEIKAGLAAIRARLGYRGPRVSLTEMDAAVLREAARRDAGTKPARRRVR